MARGFRPRVWGWGAGLMEAGEAGETFVDEGADDGEGGGAEIEGVAGVEAGDDAVAHRRHVVAEGENETVENFEHDEAEYDPRAEPGRVLLVEATGAGGQRGHCGHSIRGERGDVKDYFRW